MVDTLALEGVPYQNSGVYVRTLKLYGGVGKGAWGRRGFKTFERNFQGASDFPGHAGAEDIGW